LGQARVTAEEYGRVLQAIDDYGLMATISVKPTALGLLLDRPHCDDALDQLINAAKHHGTSACIDMEDTHCTQRQIDQYLGLATRHDNVSLALQAYLKRTDSDLDVNPPGNLGGRLV
jgi:proline dehydrogenase